MIGGGSSVFRIAQLAFALRELLIRADFGFYLIPLEKKS